MVRTMQVHAGTNLIQNILERIWAVDGETHKEQVGLGVGKRSQSVVLFLARSVPQRELNALARWLVLYMRDVVFEDGWYVFLRRTWSECALTSHL